MLRRLFLACLLFAAAVSLTSLHPLVGVSFALCVALSPTLVAFVLNSVRDGSPLEF